MKLGDYANIYLSVFSHIESELTSRGLIVSGVGTGVTLLDAYPDDDQIKKIVYYSDYTGASDEIVLPVISIEQSSAITADPFELSSLNTELTYPIVLTAFLETNIQRLQFETLLHDIIIKKEITYYDYDSNFDNPVSSGTLLVDNYTTVPVQFSPTNGNKFLKWGIDCMFTISRVVE